MPMAYCYCSTARSSDGSHSLKDHNIKSSFGTGLTPTSSENGGTDCFYWPLPHFATRTQNGKIKQEMNGELF